MLVLVSFDFGGVLWAGVFVCFDIAIIVVSISVSVYGCLVACFGVCFALLKCGCVGFTGLVC